MTTALIGFTGLVGSTLLGQSAFDELYNSSNIHEIPGHTFDLVVCAGAPATKWKANQEPEQDLANIQRLIGHLSQIETARFVLISTVDVYANPVGAVEDTAILPSALNPYGRHRFFLEEFVRNRFENHSVVRLPGLFGHGLKKNFIFDLLHNNCLDLTDAQSRFQFYNLARLGADLNAVLDQQIPLINFATEPVIAADVAAKCFGIDFVNRTKSGPARYDMRTKYAGLFGGSNGYMVSADEILNQIRRFAIEEMQVVHYETVNV